MTLPSSHPLLARSPLATAALACTALLAVCAVNVGAGAPTRAEAYSTSYTHVGGTPGAVGVDSTTHTVFVADPSSDEVALFDGSLDAPTVTRVKVGMHPVAIAIDEATRSVFVADSDSGTVSRLDADDPDPVASVAVHVAHPTALAVDSSTHVVYVTSSTTNRVYSFDGASGATSPDLRSVPVGQEPAGVAVDPDAGVVAVTNAHDNTVSTFAARAAADDSGAPTPVVTTVGVGSSPSGIAIDRASHIAVVADLRDNTASRFDVTSSAPSVSTVTVGRAPSAVTIDERTHTAFVANSLGQTVSQFDVAATAPPVMDVPLGKAPRGVAVDEGLGTVYASNALNETVSGRAPLTPEAPWITVDTPYTATVGVWYNHIVEAHGTPTPTLSLRGTLPKGLTFDASTGQLSGTPEAEETQTVTVVAHNLAGVDATTTYRLVVHQKAPSLIASARLSAAKVGASYSYRLATVGSAPASCAVSGGVLPPGLALSASGCSLSGKPRAAGTSEFAVTATNSGGSVTESYEIITAPAGGGTGCPDGAGGGAGGVVGAGASGVEADGAGGGGARTGGERGSGAKPGC